MATKAKNKFNIKVLIAILSVVLLILVVKVGFSKINKPQKNSDYTETQQSPSSNTSLSKEERYEALQSEIREVSRQAAAGEISQKEAQKRLAELQKQVIELQQE